MKVLVADHGNAALRVCRLLREEEVKAKLRKMMQATPPPQRNVQWSLSLRLEDLLAPVARVKKKRRKVMQATPTPDPDTRTLESRTLSREPEPRNPKPEILAHEP